MLLSSMGIFDFIGKLFEKEKTEIERVDFSDIGNWINKRKN